MPSLLEKVEILFATEELAVLNKPAGLVVHADGRTKEPNLCDWILEKFPEAAKVGEPIVRKGKPDIARPGIVHRLDRDTSGVIIVARTSEAHAYLKQQFADREVKKRYACFAHGRLKAFHLSSDEPIGRAKKDFRMYATPPHTRGKVRAAHTDFQSVEVGEKVSYVKAFPKTGRTHQVRVHLMDLGHPIVGDELYAGGRPRLLGFARQALHAEEVTFRLLDEKVASVAAPLPEDFQTALTQLKDD